MNRSTFFIAADYPAATVYFSTGAHYTATCCLKLLSQTIAA